MEHRIFARIAHFKKTPMNMREAINFEAMPHESNLRNLGGYRLPEFQRPLVWTEDQDIKLVESVWYGIDIGSYAITESQDPALDGLLLDGQQRLNALMAYQNDAFPVFGYYWTQLTKTDRLDFTHVVFPRVTLSSPTDQMMRFYYNPHELRGCSA